MSIRRRTNFTGRPVGIKYIVGIDPSLRKTGVSVHDNTGKMLKTFTIPTTAGTPDHKAIDYIVRELFEQLSAFMTDELCARKAIAFFIEDLYVASGKGGAGSLITRAKLIGVIEYLLRQAGLPTYYVPIAAMTSFLLSGATPRKSKDKKQAVMVWLHHNRNFFTKDDNQADAYGLAEFGFAYIIEGRNLTLRRVS